MAEWKTTSQAAKMVGGTEHFKMVQNVIRDMTRLGLLQGKKQENGRWLVDTTHLQEKWRQLASPTTNDSGGTSNDESGADKSLDESPDDKLRTQAGNDSDGVAEDELKIDSGMVEVSIALASIASAIVALIAGLENNSLLRWITTLASSFLAIFSAYSALWLLARYCWQEVDKGPVPQTSISESSSIKNTIKFLFDAIGITEIKWLINPEQISKLGPYWLLSIGLLFLFSLSALLALFGIVN